MVRCPQPPSRFKAYVEQSKNRANAQYANTIDSYFLLLVYIPLAAIGWQAMPAFLRPSVDSK